MFRVFDIRDIVEVDLESSILYTTMTICDGIISDTDETIGIIGMEIGRISRYLEFSEDFRIFGISSRDNKEWVNLLECDEIETITDEPR